MSFYYTYLLQSLKNKSWYIGYSEHPDKRLTEHNSGKNASTKLGRPWELIYFEAYLSKNDALGREKFLKSGSGYKYIKKQLRHYLENSAQG